MTDAPVAGADGSEAADELESSIAVPPDEPPPTPAATPPPGDDKVMSLVDHLGELRRRVAISILAVVLGAAVGFVLAPHIMKLLLTPLPGGQVVFLTLSGGFLVFMRISLVFGLLVALPGHPLPALGVRGPRAHARRAAGGLPWIPLSVVFFLLGTLVAWVTLPYAVQFLLSFQIEGTLEALPSAEAYFGFVTFIFLHLRRW